jgi:quercetin dioxygenase-like cupin family protein
MTTLDASPLGRGPARRRTRRTAVISVAALVVLAGLVGFGGTAYGGDGHGHEGITTEVLAPRSTFTDDVAVKIKFRLDGRPTDVVKLGDASTITTARITIPPGAVLPWHTHPGPVLINVADGDFVYRLAVDCVDRAYTAGEALIDAGGDNVHTAYNPGHHDTTVVATFLGAPADGPLTIPADGPDPDDCPLPTP